jgi:polysaccharide biosynthesis protein PslH
LTQNDTASEQLNCLWLARTIPLPLNTGDHIYTARLAQAFAAAGASVTFMGLSNPAAPFRDLAEVFDNRIEWSIAPGRPKPSALAFLSSLPLVAARFGTRNYVQHIKTTLRACDFDAVLLDNYAMAWAVDLFHRGHSSGKTPLIVHIAHDFATALTADIARNFRGDPLRKAALCTNAWKTANAVRKLARAADIIVTLTAEDRDSFTRFSPSSVKLVLSPGYDGPRAPDRQIVQATPRRIAIVGSYRWIAKRMNLSAFLDAADGVFQNAAVGIDVVGEVPDPIRRAWEARTKATRFHGFVDDLGEFLAARRMGLVVEETGGGFKLKTLDYIFNRAPIAAIRGSMAGLPLREGSEYLCFETMQELANGVVAVIDDFERLNYMQQAAYKKCESGFDWSDRGQTLFNAIQHALNRKRQVVDGG